MSSFRRVCEQLHRQRETEARDAAIKRLKAIRDSIAQRQQDAQRAPEDAAELLRDEKARIDERVQDMLGGDEE